MAKPTVSKVSERFSRSSLELDVEQEAGRIVEFLRTSVTQKLHRQGAVVGISGGINSSVVLALCVRAFGPQRVVGILLPEKESSPESNELAHRLAAQFGVEAITEEITSALEGAGCYRRRDKAIQRVFPEYEPGWKAKISLPGTLLEQNTLNVFSLTVARPEGQEFTRRLPPKEFSQIVAASNFKQRTRMAMLYYHSDRLNFAVVGTAQKNEHDLGFFVKYGDGGVDVSPILHLFKSQVFQLAEYLGIPDEIRRRTPTTDTYPGGSTQEEFFYRIPFEILDLAWLGLEQGVPLDEIAVALDLTPKQVTWIEADIQRKQRATEYLRTTPLGL